MLGASVRRDVVDAGHTTVRQETAALRDFSPSMSGLGQSQPTRQTRRWPMSGIGPKAARLTRPQNAFSGAWKVDLRTLPTEATVGPIPLCGVNRIDRRVNVFTRSHARSPVHT